MKLVMHTSIFSVIFAGILASAITTKPTSRVTGSHSLVVSSGMPIPSCAPDTGCINAMPIPSCAPDTGCVNAMPIPSCAPDTGCVN
jgi:hypothetical protein